MIYGHEDIVAALERDLPPVTLLIGPPSVGKWAVAEYFREKAKIQRGDVLRVHKLTADSARDVVRFAGTAPAGPQKMALVRLDWAKPTIMNILLKTLEEPGEVKFFLTAEQPVLPAVMSRAVVYRFGRLTKEQVASVLVERNKMTPQSALKLAAIGTGQIRSTMKQLELAPDRNRLMTVVRALREHDHELAESMANEWTDETTELLAEWCMEALSGRYRYFNAEQASLTNIGKAIPLEILRALASDPRPRWVVRAVVLPLLRGA